MAKQYWQSGSQQTTLLELFTSEGCSSCPVADRWLSRWVKRQELWQEVIPIAFHVDYWDDLGWPDKFSSPSYTQRQQKYKQQGHSSSVYTPAFMVNGQEWRGFFSRKPFPFTAKNNMGILRGELKQNLLTVSFSPSTAVADKLTLHIAMLGMHINNDIYAGENHGKTLQHNFVALNLYQQSGKNISGHYQWQQEISLAPIKGEAIDAIAFWVTEHKRMSPLQAAGGLLQ